jgi:hypothetical protein
MDRYFFWTAIFGSKYSLLHALLFGFQVLNPLFAQLTRSS